MCLAVCVRYVQRSDIDSPHFRLPDVADSNQHLAGFFNKHTHHRFLEECSLLLPLPALFINTLCVSVCVWVGVYVN